MARNREPDATHPQTSPAAPCSDRDEPTAGIHPAARGSRLACALRHDQRDVVLLFLRTKMSHFLDDRSQHGLGRQLLVLPERYHESLLAKLLAGRTRRLGARA